MDGMERMGGAPRASVSPEEAERIKKKMFVAMKQTTPHRAVVVLSRIDSNQPNDLTFKWGADENAHFLHSTHELEPTSKELIVGAQLAKEAMEEKRRQSFPSAAE